MGAKIKKGPHLFQYVYSSTDVFCFSLMQHILLLFYEVRKNTSMHMFQSTVPKHRPETWGSSSLPQWVPWSRLSLFPKRSMNSTYILYICGQNHTCCSNSNIFTWLLDQLKRRDVSYCNQDKLDAYACPPPVFQGLCCCGHLNVKTLYLAAKRTLRRQKQLTHSQYAWNLKDRTFESRGAAGNGQRRLCHRWVGFACWWAVVNYICTDDQHEDTSSPSL
jgi:hypothetical protein